MKISTDYGDVNAEDMKLKINSDKRREKNACKEQTRIKGGKVSLQRTGIPSVNGILKMKRNRKFSGKVVYKKAKKRYYN